MPWADAKAERQDEEKEETRVETKQQGPQHQNIPSTSSVADELLSFLDKESKGEMLNTEPLILQVEEAEETIDKHKFEKIVKECQKNIPVVHVVQSKKLDTAGETDFTLRTLLNLDSWTKMKKMMEFLEYWTI